MYFSIVGTNVRLAGTLHRWPSDAGDCELPTWVWEAYKWSEELCFEMDMSKIGAIARFPDGDSLERKLPADVWAALRDAYPPEVNLGAVKQWALLFELQTLGIPMVDGVEPQISRQALMDLKPIHYLETAEEFAALTTALSDDQYAELLLRVLRDRAGFRKALYTMHEVWLTGSLAEVTRPLPATLLGIPEISDLILTARNRHWFPRLLDTIASGRRVLVGVGAAHLPGTNGLLYLLRRAGYDTQLVRQV